MSGRDDYDKYKKYTDYDQYEARFDYKYPTSSRTSPNRRDYDEGGVEYIPSERPSRHSLDETRVYKQPSGAKRQPNIPAKYGGGSGRSGAGKKRMSSQSQSAVFMAVIVGVGILVCLGAFFLMFNLLKPSPVKTDNESNAAAEEPGPESGGDSVENGEQAAAVTDAQLLGAIQSISGGTITIISFESDSPEQVFVNQDTRFMDKYGGPLTLPHFVEGDIVIAEYDSLTKRAQVFKLDPEAWERASIRNVEINQATATVKIGNDTLSFSKGAVFLPPGTEPSIKPSDVVTLKGHKTKIMTVIVEKRSGTIEFINKDKITDGTVEVDADIYKALEETGSLKVSTGAHTVVVKGANIDVFIKEITVNEGETVTIDLSEAPIKEGVVNLTVNEPDYTVFVNDEQVASTNEPLTLPFGAYKLRVTKEGFTPWEGTVTVNQPSVSVSATLTAEVKMGQVTVLITEPIGLTGCSVYIDNALIGTAPVYRASVTYGTHQLTVKAPGYVDTSTPIIVEGEVTYNVTMHLLSENTGNQGNTEAPITPGSSAPEQSTREADSTGAGIYGIEGTQPSQ